MAKKIQQYRGLEKDLPILEEARLAFTTDTKKLFIGSNNGNIEITNEGFKNGIISQLEETIQDTYDNINTRSINAKHPPANLKACKGDGTTNDSSARDAIIAYALENGFGEIYFPDGTYKFTTGFTLDPRKLSLTGGNKTVFEYSTMTTGDAIHIRTNEAFGFHTRPAMSNITLHGSQSLSNTANAIYYGGKTVGDGFHAYGYEFHKVNFVGFSSHHVFGHNAFISKWSRCSHFYWTGNSIRFIANVTNAGENMLFEHCNWNNAAVNTAKIFDLDYGFTIFNACSFDYMGRIGSLYGAGAPSVRFVGGHIEYGFPIDRLTTQAAFPMIDMTRGSFVCTDSVLFLAKGVTEPFLIADGVCNAIFANNTLRLTTAQSSATSPDYLIQSKGLANVRINNTVYDAPAPTGQNEKIIKPVKNTGMLGQTLAYFTTSGGTVDVIEDATHGKCISMTSVSTNTVSVETPLIPISFDDEIISEFKYKFVVPMGGTLYIRHMLYDIKGTLIGTTQPHGSFTDNQTSTNWIRKLGIFKTLKQNPEPYITHLKIRIEIFGATGEGSNALIQIPYLTIL